MKSKEVRGEVVGISFRHTRSAHAQSLLRAMSLLNRSFFAVLKQRYLATGLASPQSSHSSRTFLRSSVQMRGFREIGRAHV